MIKLVVAVLFIFLFSCNGVLHNGKVNSIRIIDSAFIDTLRVFEDRARFLMKENDRLFSVSIWQNKKDTVIGFYAFKKLRPAYYIGCLEFEGTEVYFYSNLNSSIKGLFEIVSKPRIYEDSILDFGNTYSEYYEYKNGELLFMEPRR